MRLTLARAGFSRADVDAMPVTEAAAYMALLALETPSSAYMPVPSAPVAGGNVKTLIPMRRRSKRNE